MHNIETTNKPNTEATSSLDAIPENSAFINRILDREIQSAIGYRSTISVECTNGVVTLNGYFANKRDKYNALNKAIVNPGVSRIINNAN